MGVYFRAVEYDNGGRKSITLSYVEDGEKGVDMIMRTVSGVPPDPRFEIRIEDKGALLASFKMDEAGRVFSASLAPQGDVCRAELFARLAGEADVAARQVGKSRANISDKIVEMFLD